MANYDLIFGILFYVLVIFFFYIMRKNVTIKGILFIYRTKAGLKAMDKIANIFPRLLKGMEPVSIIIGFISMAALFIFLIYYTFLLFIRPDTPAALAPLLPGVRIPGLPILPFWFFIISVFFIIIVHESAHGVFARLHNLKIKSSGLVFLGPLPGAFVEPDEKKMSKLSAKAQLGILSAGSFANIILFLVVFLISILILSPFTSSLLDDNQVMINKLEEGFPLEKGGIEEGEIILSVNDNDVINVLSFTEFMAKTKPGDELLIKTDKRKAKVIAAEHPRGENFGYLGVVIGPANFTAFENVILWFTRLFFWIWLISLGVGLFNWLPLFITDGGRMAYVLTHKIFNDKKKALRAWSSINLLCLFIILIQLGAFFVQLF